MAELAAGGSSGLAAQTLEHFARVGRVLGLIPSLAVAFLSNPDTFVPWTIPCTREVETLAGR